MRSVDSRYGQAVWRDRIRMRSHQLPRAAAKELMPIAASGAWPTDVATPRGPTWVVILPRPSFDSGRGQRRRLGDQALLKPSKEGD
jgi:hypothetical protein